MKATIDSLVLARVYDDRRFLPTEAAIYSLDFAGVDRVASFAHEGSYRFAEVFSELVVFVGFCPSWQLSSVLPIGGNYRFVGSCPS